MAPSALSANSNIAPPACAPTCSSVLARRCLPSFLRGLAAEPSDCTRIAAQIIPGIGFIGAGSILHTRGLTSGLTSAATIFVVASVGMAAGGGLYLTAVFATAMVLLALFLLGHMEETFNVKIADERATRLRAPASKKSATRLTASSKPIIA